MSQIHTEMPPPDVIVDHIYKFNLVMVKTFISMLAQVMHERCTLNPSLSIAAIEKEWHKKGIMVRFPLAKVTASQSQIYEWDVYDESDRTGLRFSFRILRQLLRQQSYDLQRIVVDPSMDKFIVFLIPLEQVPVSDEFNFDVPPSYAEAIASTSKKSKKRGIARLSGLLGKYLWT